jgi:hypothetical protein
MFRTIFVLALCLVCLDQRPARPEKESPDNEDAKRVVAAPQRVIEGVDLVRQEILAGIALAPTQGFPGNLAWYPMIQIGQRDLYPLENLLHFQPLLFLEMCLERYEREIQGYSCVFRKRERIKGKLLPLEKLEVHFREKPFSVYMNWLEGASLAQKVLFVRGDNSGKMLARPRFLPLVVTRDIDGADAKGGSRYTIDQFGIGLGTERTLTSMRAAQARGALHLQYKGLFQEPRVGDRNCHVFVRSPYDPLEEEGLNELTLYIDQENWLQIGSELKDREGNIIAEYFFRDVQINPSFKKDQFTRAGL